MDNPKFLAAIRREGDMMRHHPENDAVDEWVEALIDWDFNWPPFDPP
jgi:hypothetical protein